MKWLVAGFLFMGLLVGNLVGMSATSVTTSILGLLFAFAGGTAVAFLQKLSAEQIKIAGKAILVLSLSCLVGLYAGILVTEHQLLTPPERAATRVSVVDSKYLRAELVDPASRIEIDLKQKRITPEEAVELLQDLIDEIAQSTEK